MVRRNIVSNETWHFTVLSSAGKSHAMRLRWW
jgi:hypothetical protein